MTFTSADVGAVEGAHGPEHWVAEFEHTPNGPVEVAFHERPDDSAIEYLMGHFDATQVTVTAPRQEVTRENRFFFYGTLMNGQGRDGLMHQYGRCIGRATIKGRMYEVGQGSFPAVVDGEGEVHGEVWEAHNHVALLQMTRACDLIEGFRENDPESLYFRQWATLIKAMGEPNVGDQVWVYRWNDTRDGMKWLGARVASGDWRDR